MRINLKLFLLLIFIPSFAFSQNKKNNPPVIKNEIDSVSYALGVIMGNNMKNAGFTTVNEKLFGQGVLDVLSEKQTIISTEMTNTIVQSYVMKLYNLKASKNLIEGKQFLEENKKKEGIITLPSGLQYKVIKEGTGESPTINDKVTCHYEGRLINGKVFDSSIQRGQPAQFPLNGVISGWTEALQLMKTGSKWTVYVPAELGYGEQNVPGIEPNSVLIFDIELISIEKGTAEQNQENN